MSAKTLLAGALLLAGIGLHLDAAEISDEEAITAVIEGAYVQGFCVHMDPAMVREGFHEEFRVIFRDSDDAVGIWGRDEFVAYMLNEKTKRPADAKPTFRARYPIVNVKGHAAVVRVQILRNDELFYDDFLSLYKMASGWKIVAKTF